MKKCLATFTNIVFPTFFWHDNFFKCSKKHINRYPTKLCPLLYNFENGGSHVVYYSMGIPGHVSDNLFDILDLKLSNSKSFRIHQSQNCIFTAAILTAILFSYLRTKIGVIKMIFLFTAIKERDWDNHVPYLRHQRAHEMTIFPGLLTKMYRFVLYLRKLCSTNLLIFSSWAVDSLVLTVRARVVWIDFILSVFR